MSIDYIGHENTSHNTLFCRRTIQQSLLSVVCYTTDRSSFKLVVFISDLGLFICF